MESELFTLLSGLGIPIVPVSPGHTEDFNTSQVVLPMVEYQRKNTHFDLMLDGSIVAEYITVVVSYYGTTFTEAINLAQQARGLISGVTSNGYEFTLSDEYVDPKFATLYHQNFEVFKIR